LWNLVAYGGKTEAAALMCAMPGHAIRAEASLTISTDELTVWRIARRLLTPVSLLPLLFLLTAVSLLVQGGELTSLFDALITDVVLALGVFLMLRNDARMRPVYRYVCLQGLFHLARLALETYLLMLPHDRYLLKICGLHAMSPATLCLVYAPAVYTLALVAVAAAVHKVLAVSEGAVVPWKNAAGQRRALFSVIGTVVGFGAGLAVCIGARLSLRPFLYPDGAFVYYGNEVLCVLAAMLLIVKAGVMLETLLADAVTRLVVRYQDRSPALNGTSPIVTAEQIIEPYEPAQ